MTTVNVYLTFNGNCREAFDFYKSVFGGEFAYIGTFGDMPPQEGSEMPDDEKERIMHVSLPVSKETILMGSDASSFSGNAIFGNNFSVSINTDNKEDATRLFNKLSEGGIITMPL